MHSKADAKTLFISALDALGAQNLSFDLSLIPKEGKVTLLGSGKASLEMAKALLPQVSHRLQKGLIVSNYFEFLEGVEVLVASHPIPSVKSIEAAERMILEMEALEGKDFFIYLLSGGTSALLEKPIAPVSLEVLGWLSGQLLLKGASIDELNIVRKHLSFIKGGRLGQMTRAKGVVYVVSDVIGDDFGTIGSGPLFYDHSTCAQAKEILVKYNLWQESPESIREVIGLCRHESPKVPNTNILHRIVASNKIALMHIAKEARRMGYVPTIVTDTLSGDVQDVAKYIVVEAKKREVEDYPLCLIFGGESTVKVKGEGRGGRNQELALWVLKEMDSQELKATFLSGGTDGIDGNSDAAGAVVESGDLREDIDTFLKNSDSYHYHKRQNTLLITGESGTNVMDIMILIKE